MSKENEKQGGNEKPKEKIIIPQDLVDVPSDKSKSGDAQNSGGDKNDKVK
jgi:hypothetical protein